MKISVIIITRNRKDDLKKTIDAYNSQTYADKEIILIDNASGDGTREMMERDYPDIKFLWLPDNLFTISINIGISMSSGDIIWRTDDDSYPESNKTFEDVVKIFSEYPDIGIISTENIEVNKGNQVGHWHPLKVDKVSVPKEGYKSNAFAGSGAGIRREIFDKIGGFWEFGFEEVDFCTRAQLAGYNIRYFPNIRTLHFASIGERNMVDRWVQYSKQRMRYYWKFFPFFKALANGAWLVFYRTLWAVVYKVPIKTIFEGYFGMITIALQARRKEKQIVPSNKMYDVTLGVSFIKSDIRYILNRVKSRFSNK